MSTSTTSHNSVANKKVLFIDREQQLSKDKRTALQRILPEKEVIVDKEMADDLNGVKYIFYLIEEYRLETLKWLEKELNEVHKEHMTTVIMTVQKPKRMLFPYLHNGLNGIVSMNHFLHNGREIIETLDRYHCYMEQDLHKELVEDIQTKKLRDRPIRKLVLRQEDVKHVLTKNESRVLQHILDGHNNQQIADLLYLAPSTISTVISHLLKKLDANDRTDAMVIIIRRGWVDAKR